MDSATTIDCRRCGRPVTAEAPRCPECGADPRTGESAFRGRGTDRARVCQGVGIRLAATAIDVVVLFAAFILVSLVIYLFLMGAGEFAVVGEEPSSMPFWIVFFIAWFFYYWVCEGVWGRTLGKRLCSLRVVRKDGGRIGIGAALVRTLLRLVDALPAFYLVGALLLWLTPLDQRLGDLLAGTVVVRPQMVALNRLSDLRERVIPWRAG